MRDCGACWWLAYGSWLSGIINAGRELYYTESSISPKIIFLRLNRAIGLDARYFLLPVLDYYSVIFRNSGRVFNIPTFCQTA
jgi:hypothetical protein